MMGGGGDTAGGWTASMHSEPQVEQPDGYGGYGGYGGNGAFAAYGG
jgi:hypothetical protein